MKYKAEIRLTKKARKTIDIEVEVDKTIEETTFDDVESAIYLELEGVCPCEEYPDSEIVGVFVYDGGKMYPCVSEEQNYEGMYGEYGKVLVLPCATYSLTPECRLYLELQKNNVISEREEFDFKKYHTILESMKRSEKEG